MSKTIYLTIDDAPSSDCLNKLDYLDQHGIKAVWFCEGKRIEEFPTYTAEILKRGHIIGNHLYSHPWCSDTPVETIRHEIDLTDNLINQVHGTTGITRTQHFFRFPYGDKGDGLRGDVLATPTADGQERREAIQAHLRDHGYTQPAFPDVTYQYYRSAGLLEEVDWFWTYDTHDWCPYNENPSHGIDSVEKVLDRLDDDVPEDTRGINYAGSADIVLIHDHVTPDHIFQQIVDKLISKGVTFALPA